jgi:hypothetical protein
MLGKLYLTLSLHYVGKQCVNEIHPANLKIQNILAKYFIYSENTITPMNA